MAIAGTIIILVIIAIFIGLIVWANVGESKRDGSPRTYLYLNLKTGFMTYLDPEVKNFGDIVRHDTLTNEPFVMREKGMLDKGDPRQDITKNHIKREYSNFGLVLDYPELLEPILVNDKEKYRKLFLDEKATHDYTKVQLLQFQTKYGSIMQEQIKTLGTMRDAALPFFDMSKAKKKV